MLRVTKEPVNNSEEGFAILDIQEKIARVCMCVIQKGKHN